MEIRSIKCAVYSLNNLTIVIVSFLMIICPHVSSEVPSPQVSSSSHIGDRKAISINCSKPLMATYYCELPQIDPETQQPVNCGKNNRAKINCSLYDGFYCDGQKNITSFEREIECLYTNGYHFETALLLSIFLGMFGADRFYLGYPAIGLLKLCTFGCFFILQFIDVILIALQVLKPVDNSNYIMKYYGPRLKILYADNDTFPLSRNEL